MRTLTVIPRSIWFLGCVSLCMDISSEMIHSLLPLFMLNTLQLDVVLIGLLEGLAEATALSVKVFSGMLSDYWGKRKTLALTGYTLGACTKPLFALATGPGMLLSARLIDRVGKGIRGAPRDALIADITPPHLRGAAFGLRQALDNVGAVIGPLLATALMLLWHNDFRAVFWVALLPGGLAVLILWLGVHEPTRQQSSTPVNPLTKTNLQRLTAAYWWVVLLGALFMLARFSEAFLVLRGQQVGIPTAYLPLIMVGMNAIYAAVAYPFGKLADRVAHQRLLSIALLVLMLADFCLAHNSGWLLIAGVSLWGIHLGLSQGLLTAMIANTAPTELRGTAYGLFNLLSGLALLFASILAGWLWQRYDARFTFYTGAAFCALTWFIVQLKPQVNVR